MVDLGEEGVSSDVSVGFERPSVWSFSELRGPCAPPKVATKSSSLPVGSAVEVSRTQSPAHTAVVLTCVAVGARPHSPPHKRKI